MINRQRLLLIVLLLVAVVLLLLVPLVALFTWSHATIAKMIGSTGLFLDLAGIIQLEISGAFESLIDKYGNVEEYPGGPPSHITRQIIDDPEAPITTALRNHLFF